ncbi:MAG: hypothetical protein KME35_19740 [Aphanocapsa sp. GSE-SYN-MK-11-07L]|jgi:hypothetical protein|nr:hypothetical protein [Aphanocapsa sp. GSE-SYN-MK-11-07L]
MKFRYKKLISLLLGTGCLLAIAVALPINRQGTAEESEVKGQTVEGLVQLQNEFPQRLKSPSREALDPKVIQQQTEQIQVFNDSIDRFGPVRLSP